MAIADLIIRLRDNASQGIRGISGSLAGLRSQAGDAASGTQSFANSVAEGVLKANALQFALQKAGDAVGFLTGKFEESKNLQLESISAATTLSSLTGLSSEEAAKSLERINNVLAKSSATLPGATSDYQALARAIQDNVVDAFKDPAGVLNQEGFEKTLASLSESYGALTAATTRDIGNTQLGLTKALGGASISELRNIAFFEQNQTILRELEQRLAAQGRELKDLNMAERVQLLQEVGAKFITEDFKEQAARSVDGLLQSFISTLFDPGGVFGLNRDLDGSTQEVESVFKSLNDALYELIGPSSVFSLASEIFLELGGEALDPMVALKKAIDVGVRGLKTVNQGLTYIRDFAKAGADLGDTIRFALGLIVNPNIFNPGNISDRISTFITGIGMKIGGFFSMVVDQAAPLFNQGVRLVSEFFSDPTKFHEIGVAIGGFIGKLTGNVITFLSRVDYPQLLVGVGRIALSLGTAVLGAIGGAVLGVLPSLGELLLNVGRSLLQGMEIFVLAAKQTIADTFGMIASLSMMPIRGLISLVTGIINFHVGAVKSFLDGGIGGLFQYVIDAFKSIVSIGERLIDGALDQIRSIPGVGGLVPPSPATASSFGAIALQSATPITVGSRYSGQVGWAAGGFLGDLVGAAQREMGAMPAGAQLMIANSSETILPRGVLGDFVRAIAPTAVTAPAIATSSGGGSVTIGDINIYPTSGDPSAIAGEVMARLQQAFDAQMASQLG